MMIWSILYCLESTLLFPSAILVLDYLLNTKKVQGIFFALDEIVVYGCTNDQMGSFKKKIHKMGSVPINI